MDTQRPTPASLRAEARVLATAGLLLLLVGFPLTLSLVARELQETAAAPFLPAAIGAPPIMLGYLACCFASRRMVKAKALEGETQAGLRAPAC
jgi:hypothetical protein